MLWDEFDAASVKHVCREHMYVCVCIGFIVLIYLLSVKLARQQHVFTNNTHVSVMVIISIQKPLTHIHSDIVASPY